MIAGSGRSSDVSSADRVALCTVQQSYVREKCCNEPLTAENCWLFECRKVLREYTGCCADASSQSIADMSHSVSPCSNIMFPGCDRQQIRKILDVPLSSSAYDDIRTTRRPQSSAHPKAP